MEKSITDFLINEAIRNKGISYIKNIIEELELKRHSFLKTEEGVRLQDLIALRLGFPMYMDNLDEVVSFTNEYGEITEGYGRSYSKNHRVRRVHYIFSKKLISEACESLSVSEMYDLLFKACRLKKCYFKKDEDEVHLSSLAKNYEDLVILLFFDGNLEKYKIKLNSSLKL